MNQRITVETQVNAPLEVVWSFWTGTKHIEVWNAASKDWYTPQAINNLKIGGRFTYRMEARDGSSGFDFAGTYTTIVPNEKIEYKLDDGRVVRIDFIPENGMVSIVETFEPETIHGLDMQRVGWQTILDSFKAYTEKNSKQGFLSGVKKLFTR